VEGHDRDDRHGPQPLDVRPEIRFRAVRTATSSRRGAGR